MKDKSFSQYCKYQAVSGSEGKEENSKELCADIKISGSQQTLQISDSDSKAKTNLAFSLIAVFTGTLVAISDGMMYGWTSPMVPYFLSNETHINITRSDAEYMETIMFIGAVAGLPCTILGVEYLGRKYSLILSAIMGCACWIIILVVNNLKWIFAARFFSGMVGDMCFVAAPMYIAEIAEPKFRGFLSATVYLMMITGVLTVYIVGSFAPYSIVPCIGIVLNACQIITFPFMPESPYYLVYKNKNDKARKSLVRLRANTNVDREFLEIEKAVERQKTEKRRPHTMHYS